MIFDLLLGAIDGRIQIAAAAIGVPIGIGLIGFKACESVGRNPEAATPILVQSILCMAFGSDYFLCHLPWLISFNHRCAINTAVISFKLFSIMYKFISVCLFSLFLTLGLQAADISADAALSVESESVTLLKSLEELK